MLGERDVVLYVGKAKNLRRRLAQYVHYSGPAHAKSAVMLAQVRRVETILTATEKEALLLEASLIKKHRPKYNVILRDDKQYPLIKLTVHEAWPRIVVTRRRLRDGSRYFGPYASAPALRETLNLLNILFPLRRCRRMQQRSRPCLNYQLQRCLAPCAGLADKAAYQAQVDEVLLILEGKSRQLLDRLEAEMKQAAVQLAFEQAARCRDRIASLRTTLERQNVAAAADCNQDVFGLARQEAAVGIAVLTVRSGLVSGAQTFFLADPLGEDGRILCEALLQLYTEDNPPPHDILLPMPVDDQDLVTERLAELRQGTVHLHTPQRGEKLRLLRMADENAAAVLASKQGQSWESIAATLQGKLHLRRPPEVIECLDISNLLGKQAVASLVCFVHGEKEEARCVRFRILLKDEPDDYAMMDEALHRRAAVWQEEERWPDLLLLDGGKGQLNVAAKVLAEFGLLGRMDIAAIAKEKEEEGEKLFVPGRKNPVLLPRHAPALLCLMRIRDEAHRFGITLHRTLRSQAALHSELDKLPGLGEARRRRLLHVFGSWQRIQAASADELAAVPGIGKRLAEEIWRRAHEGRFS
jgi:excinuclease ABC subunit C